jgi:UDP-N-acetylmuramoylalanine--D-glutamate ligase
VGARYVAPPDLDPVLSEATIAVISPGIPLTAELVRRVQAAGVPVYSEIEVAYRICAAPIVAVTGTKGKTTTTSLIGELFRAAGYGTHVGGNIGNALIAEVSSFQLESIRSFKPRIATILNLSPDHLDRYHSMDEYAEAKFRVFANQGPGDTFVGNLDDPLVGGLAAPEPEAQRVPSRALWYARAPHRLTTLYVRDDRVVYAPPTGDPRPVEVMPTSEIPLLGEHNLENVLAAILVGLAAGIDPAVLREGVRSFEPLPHRLQRVAEQNGVLFIDDSKATNPGAVIAALHAFEQPVVLIAGGRSKRTDFRELGNETVRRTKAVVLIGEAADDLAAATSGVETARAESMGEAVRIARALADPGDVVLLSPGCASFDMFASAEERGDAFVEAVMAPAVEASPCR